MKALVIGASGYIGGSVAAKLKSLNFEVTGTTSSHDRAAALKEMGIEPVVGSYKDRDFIFPLCQKVDIVINAADSDARQLVESVLAALKGTNKKFIHTSGSSIVSDTACGEYSEQTYDEMTPLNPVPQKEARVAIDRLILDASASGVHTVVICPCLIYGRGLGLSKESIQVPALINQAKKSGVARCVGRGLNVWSTVHVEDLVELYALAAGGAVPSGAFLFAENGETNFKSLAEAIRASLKLAAPVEEWSIADAASEWGEGMAKFALGSNSRIRGIKSREYGWKPVRNNVLEDADRMCHSSDIRIAVH
ncbi:MAG: NAD-dependent epimerase/dehydratase family protein [Candidatus Obscuribacterales bacterium]|nr:NAD-dependent epimerase/dehydratase family protein [Candidatus Obscuribacterales bacterium]